MSEDWEQDEEIGYGKPPSWTRYPKGKSGNYDGRPPKDKPPKSVGTDSAADQQLRAALDRKIRVTDAKGTRQITAAEAIAVSQVNNAARGDVTAQRDVLRAQQELELRELERARIAKQAELEKRDRLFRFVEDLKLDQTKVWQVAAAEGRNEPDEPWPHPEDIELNYVNKAFHIRGPVDETNLAHFEYLRAEREAHFSEAILCMRSRNKATRSKGGFYMLLCTAHDVLLPKRWQISHCYEEVAWILLVMPLKFIKEDVKRWRDKAEQLRPMESRLPIYLSDAYGPINKMMKPLLKPLGYRSLAQFERAWQDAGGDPGPRRALPA